MENVCKDLWKSNFTYVLYSSCVFPHAHYNYKYYISWLHYKPNSF